MIALPASEMGLYDLLAADPVVLSIVGQYNPESLALVDPNVHAHVVPENDTVATTSGGPVKLPRYPCILITNSHLGNDVSEDPSSILLVDPEYTVRGIFEGTDLLGPVRLGETLGDVVRLAQRIFTVLHGANWANDAGTVVGCLEQQPFQRIGYNAAGQAYSELGSVFLCLVEDND